MDQDRRSFDNKLYSLGVETDSSRQVAVLINQAQENVNEILLQLYISFSHAIVFNEDNGGGSLGDLVIMKLSRSG